MDYFVIAATAVLVLVALYAVTRALRADSFVRKRPWWIQDSFRGSRLWSRFFRRFDFLAPGPMELDENGRRRSLSERLSAAGWRLYYSPSCGACKMQMAELELHGGLRGLERIPCDGVHPCPPAVPMWENTDTGAVISGLQRAPQLEAILAAGNEPQPAP